MKWSKVISFWEWLLFLLCLTVSFLLLFFHFNEKWSSLNYKGIKALRTKDLTMAQKYFQQALTKDSQNPWSHLNLALSYDLLKSHREAIQTYQIVSSQLQEKSNSAVFYSLFNQAELQGRQKNIDLALEHYQKALEFNYKEQIIKKNIELLFQKPNEEKQKDKQDNKNQKNDENKDSQEDSQNSKEDQSQKEDKASEDEKRNEQDESKEDSQNSKEDQSQKEDETSGGENRNEKDESKEPNQNSESKEEEEMSDKNNEEKNSESSKSGQADGKPKEQDSQSHDLKNLEEKAILEEIDKQESKARAKFFRGKRSFGDKTGKDW